VLATLREGFVNTWLLAKDLDAIAARAGDADLTQLCALIRSNYDYPVDSVLITSDLRVVGHVNVHASEASLPASYLTFLRRGLAAARGEEYVAEAEPPPVSAPDPASKRPAPRGLTLTPVAPTDSILDIVRGRGPGHSGLAFFGLDTTAFPTGGTLEVTVRLGGSAARGKFELCAGMDGNPQMMTPVRTLDALQPGATGTLSLEFEQGARFGLAAMTAPMTATGTTEGDVNAFLATVTVRGR